MAATFVLKKGSTGKFHFSLVATNGQVIATSEAGSPVAHARDPDWRHLQPAAGSGCRGGTRPVALRLSGGRGGGRWGTGTPAVCLPVEANGVSVLGVLALPVLLAGVGLAAVRWCWRPILVAVMVVMGGAPGGPGRPG